MGRIHLVQDGLDRRVGLKQKITPGLAEGIPGSFDGIPTLGRGDCLTGGDELGIVLDLGVGGLELGLLRVSEIGQFLGASGMGSLGVMTGRREIGDRLLTLGRDLSQRQKRRGGQGDDVSEGCLHTSIATPGLSESFAGMIFF